MMPALYAHVKFARRVLEALPEQERALAQTNQKIFELGSQGPDLLFFYAPLTGHEIVSMGQSIHHENGDRFLEAVRPRILAQKDSDLRSLEDAYMLGVVCHLCLDSICHPKINALVAQTKISHHLIEKELDKVLMREDGIDPFTCSISDHLHAFDAFAAPIADVYGISDREVKRCMHKFEAYSQLFFRPDSIKYKVCTAVLKVTKARSTRGFFANQTDDAVCAPLVKELAADVSELVPQAVEMIQAWRAFECNEIPLPESFQKTFSG